MTLFECKADIVRSIASIAEDDAPQQAWLLLCYALGESYESLVISGNRVLSQAELLRIEALKMCRIAGQPLQYILGEWDLMGLSYITDKRALIPRQDTETLIEYAIEQIRERDYKSALDMCCGTGCIGISIAVYTKISVAFSDISQDCIDLTKENAQRHNVYAHIFLSDMFDKIVGKYDIITINPPYLSKHDMDTLQTDVRAEPSLALFGGIDGLDFYRIISAQYKRYLKPNGMLLVEIGETQGKAVSEMFDSATIIRDLNGKDRVICVLN